MRGRENLSLQKCGGVPTSKSIYNTFGTSYIIYTVTKDL